MLKIDDEVGIFSRINAGESSFVVDASSLDDKSADVFVPELDADSELGLFPERIVDRESEEGNFVVDGAKLDTELGNVLVFVLETSDEVDIFSWIKADEISFVFDVSRLDGQSGSVSSLVIETDNELEFFPKKIVDGEPEKGNFVVDGTKRDAEVENIVVFVLDSGNRLGLLSRIGVEENSIVADGSRLDGISRKKTCGLTEYDSENFAEDWTKGGTDAVEGTTLDPSMENSVGV